MKFHFRVYTTSTVSGTVRHMEVPHVMQDLWRESAQRVLQEHRDLLQETLASACKAFAEEERGALQTVRQGQGQQARQSEGQEGIRQDGGRQDGSGQGQEEVAQEQLSQARSPCDAGQRGERRTSAEAPMQGLRSDEKDTWASRGLQEAFRCDLVVRQAP